MSTLISYPETLFPNVILFGGENFGEVIRHRLGHEAGAFNKISVLIRR